jgi:membrane-bound lytic murein transglycosylase B
MMNTFEARRSVIAALGLTGLTGLAGVGLTQAQAQTQTQTQAKPKKTTKPITPPPPPAPPSTIPFEPLLVTAPVQAWLARAVAAGVPESFSVPLLQTSLMQPVVKRYMDPALAGSRKNWAAYKARFTDAYRIALGQAFLRDHAATFEQAQAQYGVPASIIAAIIGVETLFGRISGNFRLIDVLPTLAFDYPRRGEYFQGELLAFMQLVQAGTLSAQTKGSFAGALGLPQFMPSSLQRWGASATGAQRIDLAGSPQDAVMSVASFLAAHGWQRGLPVAFEAPTIDELSAGALLRTDAVPTYDFISIAPHASPAAPRDIKYAVVDLQYVDLSHDYLLTTQNFHSLMQYNRSYFYASAVWYLAQRLGLSN